MPAVAEPPPRRPFAEALRRPGLALIAEHKRSSPSAGVIRDDLTLELKTKTDEIENLLKLDPNSDDGEIAVLRHQLAGLQRQVPRPRHSPTVRALLASLAKLQPPRSPSTRRRALTAR